MKIILYLKGLICILLSQLKLIMLINKHSVYYFEQIDLHSTSFKGDFQEHTVYFDVLHVRDNSIGQTKISFVGSAWLQLKPLTTLEESSLLQLKVLDKLNGVAGKLSFGVVKLAPMYSFLDFRTTFNINFIPIFAIDFSLSNKVLSKEGCSLHSFLSGSENDYIFVLNHFMHIFKEISQYWMSYGFGAKTWPTVIHKSAGPKSKKTLIFKCL